VLGNNNRSQVQGSPFMVKGKKSIKDPKFWLNMDIFQVVASLNFGLGLSKMTLFYKYTFLMQAGNENGTLNL
jgi:hypothetical protein